MPFSKNWTALDAIENELRMLDDSMRLQMPDRRYIMDTMCIDSIRRIMAEANSAARKIAMEDVDYAATVRREAA
jgi:hypothetical protein